MDQYLFNMMRRIQLPEVGAFALVIIFSACVLTCLGQGDNDGFTQIFDGKTFQGWEGDTAIWKIENGILIGEVTPAKQLKANTFLLWTAGQTNDFELKLEFLISPDGNSGINYRSEPVNGVRYGLKGYQADIDGRHQHTGQSYEERGRGFMAKRGERAVLAFRQKPAITPLAGNAESLRSHIKTSDWNECRIVARGNKLQHYINGELMSEVTDNDKTLRKLSGYLGLQVHAGPPMKVQYRNIRIKPLL